MSDYLLINILVAAVPLFLSFESKLKFYKKIPFVFVSYLITGSIYILWDAAAASRGDWSFNSNYIIGIKLFGLPIEEIMFFITVPYACIFLYETARHYLKEKNLEISRYIIYLFAFILISAGLINFDKDYTFLSFFVSGIFLLTAQMFAPDILYSKIYWQFISFSFIPFFAVNYLLTSIPIVIYNPNEILGLRITTIPLEDFFYSFSMISFYLLVYLTSEKIWLKRKKSV